MRLLARVATPDKGQKQLETWEQMEELRKPLSQSMTETPDPSSYESHVERGLHTQQLANTAEMMKSKTRQKFNDAGF